MISCPRGFIPACLGPERLLPLNKCSRLGGTTYARAVQILYSNQRCDEAFILVLTRVSQREVDRNVRVLDCVSSNDIGFQRLQTHVRSGTPRTDHQYVMRTLMKVVRSGGQVQGILTERPLGSATPPQSPVGVGFTPRTIPISGASAAI